MTETVLELEHVYKKFRRGELYDSLRDLVPAVAGRLLRGRRRDAPADRREFWALEDVSFAVARGEALGIIGANGAGKSTILKILSRILRPTLGEMRVAGRLSALIEVSAGFHPDLTGRENVFLNGTILGMSRQDIRRRFDEIVAFSGIEEFIDTPVKRYSSGMFARLGFSVAAHLDPDVLVVDEVLSVGDYAFQRRCAERMREVLTGGATIVFVSHNLRAVSELCDRVLLLERGRIATIDQPDAAIAKYLSSSAAGHQPRPGAAVAITGVTLRGANGPQVGFATGERLFVDITARAAEPANKVAVVIQIRSEEFVAVFDTSSERLGVASPNLQRGEVIACTFEMVLHLAPGSYHVATWLYQYSAQKEIDHWSNAATFFVSTDRDVRGIANLEPSVSLRVVAPAPGLVDP
jgi:ABC-type polysaccharide/polyol phosphate transport system ATPase subunit